MIYNEKRLSQRDDSLKFRSFHGKLINLLAIHCH